jgi:hypothetical protein
MGGQLSKALGMSALPCHNKGRERADSTGKLFGNKEMRILMLGLDAAGKTSKSDWVHLGVPFFFVLVTRRVTEAMDNPKEHESVG